ncbi:nuclear transport factor 2 family protein [Variovorax boronicumulans]
MPPSVFLLPSRYLLLERYRRTCNIYARSKRDSTLAEHALMVFPAPAGVLDRAATLDSIQSGSRWVHANFEKRELLRPTDRVALLVYSATASRHEGVAYRALCSSTYVKQGDAWLLALHHQTPQ